MKIVWSCIECVSRSCWFICEIVLILDVKLFEWFDDLVNCLNGM